MQYRVCPDCGSHLDPGERCDCKLDTQADKPLAHMFDRGEENEQLQIYGTRSTER